MNINPNQISHSALSTDDLPTDDNKFVTALGRGLVILSCFEQSNELSHQQIFKLTGLPKPTITRLLYTLIKINYLRYDSTTSKYQLGDRTQLLSQSIDSQSIDSQSVSPSATSKPNNPFQPNPLHAQLIQSWLQDFAQTHQVSVNIATYRAGMMHYLACYRSPARISVNLSIGSEVNIEQTAIGRAYYTLVPTQNKIGILADIKQRKKPKTKQLEQKPEHVTSTSNIQKLLSAQESFYNKHGYSLSDGEYSNEILAIAVAFSIPNSTQSNNQIYAINASVPRSQWHVEELTQLVPFLKNLANQTQTLLLENC